MSSRTRVRVSGIVGALVVLAGSALPASTPFPANAQEQGTATVRVYVGDYRDSPTAIASLAGARLGLFDHDPQAKLNDNDGFTREIPLHECTSQSDGFCTFTVPIGSQIPATGRLWLAKTGATGNYYANPEWQTGPLTGGAQLRQVHHTFQTPVLEAGQTYTSYGPGRNWLTDPGQDTDPPSSIPDYGRRISSDGVLPLSRYNPDLHRQCGLDVALSVDLSASVLGYTEDLKDAMDAFVGALRGTPSQAALYTFGTDSPAAGYGENTSLRPVATTAANQAFRDLYADWGEPPTGNYTNWDRGLDAVAQANEVLAQDDRLDVVVFITDGNPTVYGPISGNDIPAGSGYTRFREIANAQASSNRLKSQDTRVIAVGVGAGISGTGAAENLRSISGRDAYDGENILDADYFQGTNYAAAGAALRQVVLSNCTPSVSVIKQVVPFDGGVEDAYTPAEPWEFTAEPSEGATVQPTTATTDPQTGALNFDMNFEGEEASLTVTEDPKTAQGYEPMPAETVCINKTAENEPEVPVTQDPANPETFSVDVGLEDAISCTVYNRAPDQNAASVQLHKRWEVTTTGPNGEPTTTTYPQGTQPPGLDAAAELTGPGDEPSSHQPWDTSRAGYDLATDQSVDVTENVENQLSGCTLTGSDIDGDPITPGEPATRPLAPGLNEWTITNELECRSHLTLRKAIASGTGDPNWWTLSALGQGEVLPGPTGRVQTDTVEVSPGATYELAEVADQPGGDVPHEVLHYVQNDLRSRPLQFPNSSGSWGCVVTDDPSGGAISTGIEGGIVIPLGQDVECTAVNDTAWLSVVKRVEGGDAVPSDFTFRAEPIGETPPGGHGHDLPGSAEPHQNFTLRPRQHYELTEAAGPPGYELTDLECTSGERTLSPEDFALEPGGVATCTATNRYAETPTTPPPPTAPTEPTQPTRPPGPVDPGDPGRTGEPGAPGGPGYGQALPITGVDVRGPLVLGILLLALGTGLAIAGRQRRSS